MPASQLANRSIATAVAAGHPEVHLMVVLVGERPEEVTHLKRLVRGEVIFSTFDQPARDHIMVAELAIEEFKGTGNMELRLRRDLAERRIFPAIDLGPSGTRRDDLLMSPQEHAAVGGLRRVLAGLDPQQALGLLLDKTRGTASNPECLRQLLSPRDGATSRREKDRAHPPAA
jgi:transcription termination factor Rho